MQRIDKAWGWEDILIINQYYVIKRLHINKGHRLSLQYHQQKTETLLLESGEVYYSVTGNDNIGHIGYMNSTTPLHIPANTVHRFTAHEDSVVLEVSTPQLDDVVRIEDDYGRAIK